MTGAADRTGGLAARGGLLDRGQQRAEAPGWAPSRRLSEQRAEAPGWAPSRRLSEQRAEAPGWTPSRRPREQLAKVAGRSRARAPVRRRHRASGERAGATCGEVADALTLLGLALRSGCGPVEAMEEVADRLSGPVGAQLRAVAAAHRWGLDPADCWRYAPPVWGPAALAWRAALTAGVSPAALVERAAEVLRDGEARRVESALARAGVLLVLPLGACFLPGFVATTVVPVVVHLLRGFTGLR